MGEGGLCGGISLKVVCHKAIEMIHTSSQSIISPNYSLVDSNLVELREQRHCWKLFLENKS
jgi:hypothetical protein